MKVPIRPMIHLAKSPDVFMQLVRGRIIGGPEVWGIEVFPQSDVPVWAGARGVWSGIMNGLSGILPTRRMTCELESGGKTHRVHVALFRDELPHEAAGHEVLVLVFPGKIWKYPSPWAVNLPPDAPGP